MDKLQWGNRKWSRRVKSKEGGAASAAADGGSVVEKRVVDGHHDLPPLPNRSSGSENGEASKRNESGKKIVVWPRLLIALSSREKDEDFMIMKGCKPSQRPQKRAKSIQRAILSVSPGAWLSDVCRERYQVREEKTSKKKPSGLKAMEMELQ
ncbi:hypothetical protein C2S53_020554 [Perilla frutescens var. hirtella]|uniref:Uncharacterized protein n=1 Tax=Perilla frutescens var. hirtella TaxID=608512 RepID=A0AAD4J9S5_PERFH|nr:hypothetical protein C2S53_020554 [Perilla frutescens var. hirtella]